MAITAKPAQKPYKIGRFLWKIVKAILQVCVALYLVVLLVLYLDQRQLIFHASSTRHLSFVPLELPAKAQNVIVHTKGGDRVSAVFGPALTPEGQLASSMAHRSTILFFYGNGDSVDWCTERFDAMRRLGMNVLIPDYVGYGRSSGQESEQNCYATADAAYDYLLARPDIDKTRIVIVGFSLGTGVAIDLAERKIRAHQPVAALASFSGFTNIPEMSHLQYPIFPEAILHPLVKYQFRNEDKIRQVTCPIMIGHSLSDHFIPYTMSDRLAVAAGGPVTRVTIDHADHSDFFAVGGPVVYPALKRFIESATSEKERAGEARNIAVKSF